MSDGSDINVDTTAPELQSFTSTTLDGDYGPTDTINVTATYDQTLDGGSTIDVVLDNGASFTLSTVVGSTISGTYTVGGTGSGEDSADLTVTSITAQSATDNSTNTNSSTTLPGTNIADGSDIVVDTSAPVLQSFTSTTADGVYGPTDTINITATYDEDLDAEVL